MIMKKSNSVTIVLMCVVLSFWGCEDTLNTTAYSELTPDNILNSEDGINSVLNGAYTDLRGFPAYAFHVWGTDVPSGLVWSRGGSIEADFVDYENFTWNSTHQQIVDHWENHYLSIRNANLVLANIDREDFSEEFTRQKTAEARFLRGYSYYMLYKTFGPTPLVTSPDELIVPRASDEEMRTFIEEDLTAAAADLSWTTNEFGRATKGSALGVLTKFFLNTKQWSETASTAQQIIDSNQHELMDNYEDVFSFEHEGNSELLWTVTYNAQGASHFINAITFPTDYPLPPGNAVFAAESYLFDDFVNSFEDEDTRTNIIVTEYINTSGNSVQLLGNDQSIPGKYPFDPNPQGPFEGSDISIVRYADILLSRAEALNEMNGPSQEAIDLINEVRERAEASQVNVSDFNQESLREFILAERNREFFFEGKSRDDQIRHGVFISNAQERGVNAQPYHRLFPVPQSELDANNEMTQNEGY